jgi:hypothetical protein
VVGLQTGRRKLARPFRLRLPPVTFPVGQARFVVGTLGGSLGGFPHPDRLLPGRVGRVGLRRAPRLILLCGLLVHRPAPVGARGAALQCCNGCAGNGRRSGGSGRPGGGVAAASVRRVHCFPPPVSADGPGIAATRPHQEQKSSLPASHDLYAEAGEAIERAILFVEDAEEVLGRAREIGRTIVARVRDVAGDVPA